MFLGRSGPARPESTGESQGGLLTMTRHCYPTPFCFLISEHTDSPFRHQRLRAYPAFFFLVRLLKLRVNSFSAFLPSDVLEWQKIGAKFQGAVDGVVVQVASI